jgi:hypothetical protein
MFARAGVINEFLRFAVHVHQSRVCGPGLLTLTRSSLVFEDVTTAEECANAMKRILDKAVGIRL